MLRILFIAISFLHIVSSSFAQLTWQSSYGDQNVGQSSYYALQLDDGGYAFIGDVGSGLSWPDILVVKTDSLGNKLWAKVLISTMSNGLGGGNSFIETYQGNLIISGFDNGAGEALLVSLDSLGSLQWAKTYGVGWFFDLTKTSDSCAIAVGMSSVTGAQSAFILKINYSGDTLWNIHLRSAGDEVFAQAIIESHDSGFVITGNSNTNASNDYNIFLTKLDKNGHVFWFHKFIAPGSDAGYDVYETSDSGFIIACGTSSFGQGIVLIKTDSLGNLIWSRTYGSIDDEYGHSVLQVNDDSIAVFGYSDSNGNRSGYLIKTDSQGSVGTNSSRIYHHGTGSSIGLTSDSGFIMTGNYYVDARLIKTDKYGNSGCNEAIVNTIVDTAIFSQLNPVLQIYSVPQAVSSANVSYFDFTSLIQNTLCSSVGIESKFVSEISAVTISPNPANTKLTIASSTISINHLKIFNALGEKILQIDIPSRIFKIDVSHFDAGIYFLLMETDEETQIDKFVKVE
jgi:hypothetical protein